MKARPKRGSQSGTGEVVLRCSACGAALTRTLRLWDGAPFRVSGRAVIGVAPPAGQYVRWDENAASAAEPYGEPVREAVHGWFVVRAEDLSPDAVVVGYRRACSSGHAVGHIDAIFEGSDDIVMLRPDAVRITHR